MTGGEAVVRTYPTEDRLTPNPVISGTITDDDPMIFDAGSIPLNTRYVDITLTASGTEVVNVGEVMLVTKFDSPQRPALGITTDYLPRRTPIEMPNGELQSVRHGGVSRVKTYRIPSMSISEADQWIDLFTDEEGASLVVLVDDVGDTYPARMNQELRADKEATRISIDLNFSEINL